MNAILYINKTGCQWRLLPREFGPWQTVYYYFRKWKLEGVFGRRRISWDSWRLGVRKVRMDSGGCTPS